MATLTKISIVVLVVLVLLACPSFITQATVGHNYRNLYETALEENELLRHQAANAMLAVQTVQRQRDQLSARLNEMNSLGQAELESLRTELARERQQRAGLQKNVDQINFELTKLRADYEHNTSRTEALAAERDEAFRKIELLNDESRRLSDLQKTTQLEADRQSEIVRTLSEQLADRNELIRQLQSRAAGVGTELPRTASEPPVAMPAQRIVGTVTAVEGDLVGVNIGSAKGLKPGMKLIIHRGPEFVAHLRVQQVEVDEAAGILFDRRLDPMRGDKIMSTLE